MRREVAARIMNEILEDEEDPWFPEQLEEYKAMGFNLQGGGLGNRGLYLFKTMDEAKRFYDISPTIRSLAWFDDYFDFDSMAGEDLN